MRAIFPLTCPRPYHVTEDNATMKIESAVIARIFRVAFTWARVLARYGEGAMKSSELGENPGISVILPVLNEEIHLADAVNSILKQRYSGYFEIILALGPSRDRTDAIAREIAAREPRVKLVDNPTGRTPNGLNAALAISQQPIIVRIDGHSEIPTDYLSIAVDTLKRTGAVNVGGIMAAEGTTRFESAVASAMRSALGVGASRFHTGGSAGDADTVYLGVFLRAALVEVGGFDERFVRAQDWELNHRLRLKGGRIYFEPRLHVTYRPRRNLSALAKQYFEYGRWRRVVSRRHEGTINLRYLAPPFTVLGCLLSIVLGLLLHPIFYIPALIYCAFIALASIRIARGFIALLLMPLILVTMHFSWGIGFLTSPKNLVP